MGPSLGTSQGTLSWVQAQQPGFQGFLIPSCCCSMGRGHWIYNDSFLRRSGDGGADSGAEPQLARLTWGGVFLARANSFTIYTDEDKSEGSGNLPKVTQQVTSRAGASLSAQRPPWEETQLR